MSTRLSPPWHEVRDSALHGRGVFAARFIPAGTYILEYEGQRLSTEEADASEPSDPSDASHTFFFALSDGTIINGGVGGNDSRFINHSCEPNCEGHENDSGTRVYIVTLRDIQPDEELLYDYALTIDDELTPELQAQYRCLCGSEHCRGTMLALPEAEMDLDTVHDLVQRLHKGQRKQRKRLKKLRHEQRELAEQLSRVENKLDQLLGLVDK